MSQIELPRCTTHHYACDCRERWMKQVCHLVARELARVVDEHGDAGAFVAYVELNEMWKAMYGREVLEAAAAPEKPATTTPKCS